MNRAALEILVTGVVLLVTMSSMFVLFQSDASLEMEKGMEFTGLDPLWASMQRGAPAKVGDSVYLLLDDRDIVDNNVTHDYTVGRLDLRSGEVEDRAITGMENLDDNTVLYELLQGEDGIYLIGHQGTSDVDHLFGRAIIYELNLQTMRIGEGWMVPELENATQCDLLIDDGLLYKMPGHVVVLGDKGTEMVPSLTIVTWDLDSHDMIDSVAVPEHLCDAVLLPFDGKFFVYWAGDKALSDSFIYNAEEDHAEPLTSLEDYDDHRMYGKSAAVCGSAMVIPYLREYVDLQWTLSDSVLALDGSYELIKGDLEMSDVGDDYWLMSCGDGDEVITMQYWVSSNGSTDASLNIAAYRLTFIERYLPFPSWLIAVPAAVVVAGLLLLLKKN